MNNDLRGMFGDFGLLLILFIAMRLMMVMVYQPLVLGEDVVVERGVGAGGDQTYYYALAARVADGELPFRDWWAEFPPVWPVTTVLVVLALGENASYGNYAIAVGLVMVLFDVGNLVMIRAIGSKLYSAATGQTLAWIYALLFAPLVFLWWTFETAVVFFVLLGIWFLINDRDWPAVVVAAFGALIKFIPALVVGAVWRFRSPRRAAIFTAVLVGLFAIPYVPLLANPATRDMTLPSLVSQFNKASYQTVWALIDGNTSTGIFGAADERLDPANAYTLRGNPPVVPGIIRLGVAGLLGLFVLWRTRRTDSRGFVAFVLITLLIFFLQAQGWSPQWLLQIVPLTLLVFPNRTGVLFATTLSFVTFTEYPVLFIRTAETGGFAEGALYTPFVTLVLVRTGLLILLSLLTYRELRKEPAE